MPEHVDVLFFDQSLDAMSDHMRRAIIRFIPEHVDVLEKYMRSHGISETQQHGQLSLTSFIYQVGMY